jgi:hypothetical protein
MTGEHVQYDGRIVPKDGFRVFIYGVDGAQKLVNSWDEYIKEIGTGVWFSKKDQVKEPFKPPVKAQIADKKSGDQGRKE